MNRYTKTAVIIAGIVVTLIPVVRLGPHLFSPGYFTEYGTGYLVGNVLLFLLGLTLTWVGFRSQKKG